MPKNCKNCGVNFEVAAEDLAFYDKVSPVIAGVKYSVPEPTHCPDCRQQRRLSFRNERNLYHRKCDKSGKVMISMHKADSGYPVYEQSVWWGDTWDGSDFAEEIDFSRSFFDQFKDFYRKVPQISLLNTACENSYFCNYVLSLKDCYLVYGGGNSEKCLYGKYVNESSYVVDGSSVYNSEFCYEVLGIEGCYECFYSKNLKNCSSSWFLRDCINCRNCFGCVGLVGAEYCLYNNQLTKEQYLTEIQKYFPLNESIIIEIENYVESLVTNLSTSHIYNSENCSGDRIYNSNNCQLAYDVKNCEDCKFIAYSPNSKNTHDSTFNAPKGVENCYEVCSTVGSYGCIGTFQVWNCADVMYSIGCHNSKYLFGCVSLKNKSYCIFNKQYSPEEYFALVQKIITNMIQCNEWGEYFPMNLSQFSYNETLAYESFPITKDQVLKMDLNWQENLNIKNNFVSSDSQKLDFSIPLEKQILSCNSCNANYRIIKAELDFYQKFNLPIPIKCHNCRYLKRLNLTPLYA